MALVAKHRWPLARHGVDKTRPHRHSVERLLKFFRSIEVRECCGPLAAAWLSDAVVDWVAMAAAPLARRSNVHARTARLAV